MTQDKLAFTLSVVIPAYNEALRLPQTLIKLEAFFLKMAFPYEILVVDDGSSDETAKLVQQSAEINPHIRLIQNEKNSGKGHAVQQGIFRASKRYVLIYDADGATPIEELSQFLPILPSRPTSIFIGSRALKSDRVARKKILWYRKVMGRCFNACLFALTPGIQDTQCGFKLFPTKMARRLFLRQTLKGFAFDVEILHAALINDIPIVEKPVSWFNVDGSKVNIFTDSWIMFASLLKIMRKSLRGHYHLPSNFKTVPAHKLLATKLLTQSNTSKSSLPGEYKKLSNAKDSIGLKA